MQETQKIDDELYRAIERRTEPNPDGVKNANGNLFTGKTRLKQEASKGNVPCSRDEVGEAVNRLIDEGRVVSWHGLLAPASEEYLKAIIRNEREYGFGRGLLINKCRKLLEDNSSQNVRESDDDRDDGDRELRTDGGEARVPLLPWCRDCWDQIGPDDAEPPEKCPECGSTDVTLL